MYGRIEHYMLRYKIANNQTTTNRNRQALLSFFLKTVSFVWPFCFLLSNRTVNGKLM